MRIVLLLMLLSFGSASAGEPAVIRLLVRGDDMGSSHAANLACLQSYRDGILRTVELMPPTPWFPEAVQLLNAHPGLDVGIHLTLTSEWTHLKWGPLTGALSLTDADGFFFPMVWPNPQFPAGHSIRESAWKLDEIERELRRQIERTLLRVPHVSHLSDHMSFTSLDPALETLVAGLAREYGLGYTYTADSVRYFQGWGDALQVEARMERFVAGLQALTPGTWIFVDHPSLDTPEMRAVFHPGYENVAEDRDAVTKVFTSPRVLAAVKDKGIQLISYRDLK